MLWLQSCIIVILIKAAISFYQLLFSVWWGFQQNTSTSDICVWVTERERERWSFLWTNAAIIEIFGKRRFYFPTLCPLSAYVFLSLSLSGSLATCVHHFKILLCLCDFLFNCALLSLSTVREKNLPLFFILFFFQIPSLGLTTQPPDPLYILFIQSVLWFFFSFLYSVLLRSEAISRF